MHAYVGYKKFLFPQLYQKKLHTFFLLLNSIRLTSYFLISYFLHACNDCTACDSRCMHHLRYKIFSNLRNWRRCLVHARSWLLFFLVTSIHKIGH